MTRATIAACATAAVLTLAAACGGYQYEGTVRDVDLSVCDPSGEFTLEGTNPYFPLEVGKRWVLEGGDERVEVTVLDETEVVAGVTTRVVEEREWEKGKEVEVSRNYFVQAADGTICYFGEAVLPEDIGGAWRADEPGHRPGIIMPANPTPGMQFATEVAPGVAEDMGLVVEVGREASVPAGRFTDTVRIMEHNPHEDEWEPNVFAAGIGPIQDEDLKLVRYEE